MFSAGDLRRQIAVDVRTSRRGLVALGATSALAIVGASAGCADADDGMAAIEQPEKRSHEAFAEYARAMRERAEREGDQPYGAVVVRAGRVIGLGPSRVVVDTDPTAHAELTAIRDACRREGTGDLTGAVLYSTSPPCPMCETAAAYAGIAQMRHGDAAEELGAPMVGGC